MHRLRWLRGSALWRIIRPQSGITISKTSESYDQENVVCACCNGAIWGIASAQDAKSVLQSATKAMGDVKSIQYSGTGHLSQLGQAFTPGGAYPETNVTSYMKTIDYASRSAKEELTRVEQIPPVKGGSRPFAGEDKQVNFVNGQYAWDQPGALQCPRSP